MQKLLLVYSHSENHATSQIWKLLPNIVFPSICGGGGGGGMAGGNGGVLSMCMKVILESSFARSGSAPTTLHTGAAPAVRVAVKT